MATKIESLPLNIVLQLAKKELMECLNTKDVEILGVGFDWDVCESDDEDERSLMVTACVDGDDEQHTADYGKHPWVMVWDENTCEFHTLQRWDQSEDNDEDDELPEGSEVIAYVGQNVGTDEIDCDMSDDELDREMKQPVTHIRMDYPFEIEGGGEYNVYPITPAKTWRELIQAVMDVCKREYAAGHNAAPHALTDYVIERVWVCPSEPGALATIGIGS